MGRIKTYDGTTTPDTVLFLDSVERFLPLLLPTFSDQTLLWYPVDLVVLLRKGGLKTNKLFVIYVNLVLISSKGYKCRFCKDGVFMTTDRFTRLKGSFFHLHKFSFVYADT